MKTDLVTLGTQIKVVDVVQILTKHSFSQFPVVDRDAGGHGRGTLVGSISRVHLFALLSRRDIFFAEGEESDALTFSDLDRAQHQLPLDDKKTIVHHLSPEDEKKMIHLSPYIQIGPHTFDGHGKCKQLPTIFALFRMIFILTIITFPLFRIGGACMGYVPCTRTSVRSLNYFQLYSTFFRIVYILNIKQLSYSLGRCMLLIRTSVLLG